MARSEPLSNDRGYILINGTLLATLIFTLLLPSSWIFWFLIEKQKTQKLCYNRVLEAQKALINTQENVLSLNRQAWRLIIEKKALNRVIAIAPIPIKVAALARRKVVISLQYKLKLQQKVLIQSGNLKSRKIAFQLRRDIKKSLLRSSKVWQSKAPQISLKTQWSKPQIKPLFREIAPPYKTVTNYKLKQRLGVQWKLNWERLLPKSWQTFVRGHSQWHGSCFAHPYRKGGKWFANIGPGRP